MAKRSPIAGYNHNVRYRGLIFHVQTEDSGLQSPHLFTHLFYGGVIITTRKLVYDAGSAEEAIKGLMQSQHKVVLRDLKRGVFDDKIDLYLAGTEGLLPRGQGASEDGEKPTIAMASLVRDAAVSCDSERGERPETAHDITHEMTELDDEPAPQISRAATPPPIPARAQPPPPARTTTADRRSPSQARGSAAQRPQPPIDLDPPTLNDGTGSIAAAIAAANATARTESLYDSDPQIQIQLELDDSDELAQPRTRSGRDTDVEMPDGRSDGVPGQIGASQSAPVHPAAAGRITSDRVSAVGAATLPPARPINRPPTRQPINHPTVVTRPPTHDDVRSRGDGDAIEADAAPPSPADPALGGDRPGQYAQHKRVSQRIPLDVVKGPADRSGSAPIPSGLSRPGRPSQQPATAPGSGGIPQRITGEPSPQTQTQPMHTSPAGRTANPSPAPYGNHAPSAGAARARPPTPARVSVSASSPTSGRMSPSSGGVVMTRPAVIVGAPAKAAAPKVRKAREEEGRGFGQGLISEKSLDEVILAYLSEDADEK